MPNLTDIERTRYHEVTIKVEFNESITKERARKFLLEILSSGQTRADIHRKAHKLSTKQYMTAFDVKGQYETPWKDESDVYPGPSVKFETQDK